MEVDVTEFLYKTGAAIVAGFFMGLERQFKGKHAGLKTNTLVSLGAAVFTIVSTTFQHTEGADMTRVIGQIIVGVGFLGAGVIIQSKDEKKVAGLATSATIWCSAAAGCLAALGLFAPLLFFTAMVVSINVLFGYLNKKVHEHNSDSSSDKSEQ